MGSPPIVSTSIAPPKILTCCKGRTGAYAESLKVIAPKRLEHIAVHKQLGSEYELSLLLVDNPFIRKLNHKWRAIDTPTDVLSFPLYEMAITELPPQGPIGDIVISIPYTAQAAKALGISLESHMTHLLIHGLLHLLGYDHIDDHDAKIMALEEASLLKAEGFDPCRHIEDIYE